MSARAPVRTTTPSARRPSPGGHMLAAVAPHPAHGAGYPLAVPDIAWLGSQNEAPRPKPGRRLSEQLFRSGVELRFCRIALHPALLERLTRRAALPLAPPLDRFGRVRGHQHVDGHFPDPGTVVAVVHRPVHLDVLQVDQRPTQETARLTCAE